MRTKSDVRMETLKENGVEVGKYLSLTLPDGLKPGAKLTLTINDDSVVIGDIVNGGHINNPFLFRRWVMSQMFRMLNCYGGYHMALQRWYGFDYQFKMMLDELKALVRIEAASKEEFEIRSTFFTKDVVVATCDYFYGLLQKEIDRLKIRMCRKKPYKTIFGTHYYCSDIADKIHLPICDDIDKIEKSKSYFELYLNLRTFYDKHRKFLKLNTTKKCPEWKNAFKGSGAYYTMQNLFRFHGCKLYSEEGTIYSGEDAVNYMNSKLQDYKGQGWRYFAMMKKVISDNNFNFNDRMREIYANKK